MGEYFFKRARRVFRRQLQGILQSIVNEFIPVGSTGPECRYGQISGSNN